MGHASIGQEPLIVKRPESSRWKTAAALATGAAAVLVLSVVSLRESVWGPVEGRDAAPNSRIWQADAKATPSDCAMVAAELSTAYQSTRRFTGSTTAELQEYLMSNGVIVSVCVDAHNNCSTWSDPPMRRNLRMTLANFRM